MRGCAIHERVGNVRVCVQGVCRVVKVRGVICRS